MRFSQLSVSEAERVSIKAEKLLKLTAGAKRFGHFSYILVFFVWVAYAYTAATHSPEAFMRSGAGLILVATFLSGIHLLICDRSKSFFGYLRTGGILDNGVSRQGVKADNDARERAFLAVWNNQLKAAKLEIEIVANVIRWEVSLATLGTLVWGYGDLLIKRVSLCGAWAC